MTTATRTDLPAMPVDDDEYIAILKARAEGELSPRAERRLDSVLIALATLDRYPDPADPHDQRVDHACDWRVMRQAWREFIAAWREEHPGQAS